MSITAIIGALVVLVNVATRLVKALTRLLQAVRKLMVVFGEIRKNEQAKSRFQLCLV
ncbi:hypothetical protein [Lacticaseibacillus manihotivorans]|uniref:hypothetical protein n=1 Tax=Lacticaseibacillus manihotivorans TaxID=88233 RepID=UPI001FB3F87B|nr:hypothetical protein [Lacticaseibacillus manihotivorans]